MNKSKSTILTAIILPTIFFGNNAISEPKALKKCQGCHTFQEGGKNKIGPNLFSIVGREAGKSNFKYSESLGNAKFIWDEKSLRAWIKNSNKAIRKLTKDDNAKTKMPKQKIKGEKADAIIEFLLKNKEQHHIIKLNDPKSIKLIPPKT